MLKGRSWGTRPLQANRESYYDYLLTADGGLSPPSVRHAKTGDTDDYVSSDVYAMAYEVADAKLGERRSRQR